MKGGKKKELTIEEMKKVNAGLDQVCEAGGSCRNGLCWFLYVAPNGDEIWGTDGSSCG